MKNVKLTTAFFVCALMLFAGCQNKETTKTINAYPDGNPMLVHVYKGNDTLNYVEIQYYSDGTKRLEGRLEKGSREDEWKSWYPDGTLWSEGKFKNGMADGYRRVFHENGTLYMEGEYAAGNRVGEWTFYDTLGNFVKRNNY
ncbi:MAG: hypothetical protein PHR20_02935 [Bacteroidales bacterium]|nr:hypothetical protein [Bacteroidales bacterium]